MARTISQAFTFTVLSTNQTPVWNSAPSPTFTQGTAANFPVSGTYQSNNYVTDADGDPITITWQTGSVGGVTWDGGKFVYNGAGNLGTTSGLVLRASDGTATADSSAFSIQIASGLAWTGLPSQFVFTAGAPGETVNLAAYVTNYNSATDVFSFHPTSGTRSWLSLTGTGGVLLTTSGLEDVDSLTINIGVSRSGGAPVYTGSLPVTVNAASTSFTTLTLTSAAGGPLLPFAFGHAFKQGDVPAGVSVASSLQNWQFTPKTYWPDGSVKFGIVAGRATLSQNIATPITLTTGTASGGANLTTSDLQATGVTAEIGLGANSVSWSGADWASPVGGLADTSGPQMSSWRYRKVISGDLVGWLEVRLYAGGAVEVLPSIENGFITGSTCVAALGTATFSLGGAQRFSYAFDGSLNEIVITNGGSGYSAQTLPVTDAVGSGSGATVTITVNGAGTITSAVISAAGSGYITPQVTLPGGSGGSISLWPKTIRDHTRIPLLTGSVFSYWFGIIDPQIAPKHDIPYLRSTKMVPNYWGTPSEAQLNAQQQTYTPNTRCGINSGMGTAGGSGALVGSNAARTNTYITSNGDARAYRHAVVFGFSGGSWSSHYRDASTHTLPLFSAYANYTTQAGQGTVVQGGSGTRTGGHVTTHQPSFGYLPYLLTGWFWFWEESAFWSVWNYLTATPAQRRIGTYFADGSAGVIDTRNGSYANRGASWPLNVLAQTFAMCPPSHPTFNNWKTTWENNTEFYYQAYITKVISVGWNAPGVLGDYGTSAYGSATFNVALGAGWMNNYQSMVWGAASDLGLPQSSTSLSRHNAVRDFSYTQIVGRCGTNSGWNYRRFAVYQQPYGTPYNVDATLTTFFNHAQAYQSYLQVYSLSSLDDAPGLTLKNYASEDDSGPSGSTTADYGMTALSALAFAVEHGAPGAAEGWTRVTEASNFSTSYGVTANFNSMAIWPRNPPSSLPSWVPALGTIADVSLAPAQTLQSVAQQGVIFFGGQPISQSGIFNSWSGVAYAESYGTYGSIIAFGGGHGDGANTDIYRYDIATRLWSRIKDSITPVHKAPDTYVADPTTGWMWADQTFSTSAMHVGEPFTPHAHSYSLWIPGSAMSGTAPNGWLLTPGRFAMPEGGQRSTYYSHRIALGVQPASTAKWELWGALLPSTHYTAWYDSGRNVIGCRPAGNTSTYRTISCTTGAVTTYSASGGAADLGYMMSAYSVADDVYMIIAKGDSSGLFRLHVIDPVTNIRHLAITSGFDLNSISGATGFAWVESWRAWVYYPGDGGNTVYTIKAPANPRTGTWVVASQTITGTARAKRNTPHFNRIRYIPALDCFIWAPDWNVPVQAFRIAQP